MEAAPLARLRALQAFSYRGYAWFWAAGFFGFGAVQMQALARGYLARELTPSPLLVSVTFAAQQAPLVIAPLIGGALGDRMDRKRLLIIAESLHFVLTLAFALLLVADAVNIGVLVAFAVAAGLTWSAGLPVRQAMVADLVAPSALTNAVVLFTGVFNGMLVLAPGLSGFIIEIAGVEGAFFTALGCTAASLALLLAVPGGTSPTPQPREAPLRALQEGVRFVRTSWSLLAVVVALSAYTSLAQTYYSILPVFQRDVLQVDASGLGLMSTMVGVGSVAASVLLVGLAPRGPKLAWMVVMGILQGLAVAAFSQSSDFGLSLGLLVVVGVFQAGFLTLNTATVQEMTPREMGGRVMALRTVPWGLQPVGQVCLGSIAEATGPQTALGAMGLGAAAFQGLVLFWVRRGARAGHSP